MFVRTKIFVGIVLAAGSAALWMALHQSSLHWVRFSLYLVAVLLSSGMKVHMPRSEGTMSVNFPFILLGIVQLSPAEAVGLGVCSVIAQCNFRVVKPFTVVQTAFNVANVTTCTVLAWFTFAVLNRIPLGFAPAITAAAGVYFLANSLPVAVVIGFESSSSPLHIWRREFFWYFPFYLVGALIAAAATLLSRSFGWATAMLLLPLVYTIYRTYNEQLASLRAKEQHMRETEALHLRTIEGLAMAIEAKDQGTHLHLQRVRVYVSELGKIMGLGSDMMQALLTAAFLHDIGKLAVPERIINKPGKLTAEEFNLMKIHPAVGADILERVRFPYPVVPIVRSHHEAWDGSGYPDGLKGEEIPLGARILSVVDCFDAIASDRPYRKALSPADALAVVKSKAGTQYDPAIVALLETHLAHLEEQAAAQMSSVAPLNTQMVVERGASPGAGFQVEHQEIAAAGASAAAQSEVAALERALAGFEAQSLLLLSQQFARTLGTRGVCQLMARRLREWMPCDCFAVYAKDDSVEDAEVLIAEYMEGAGAHAFSAEPVKFGEGITGWVAETELCSVNGNPTVEPNFRNAENTGFSERSSALSIPLFAGDGPLLGVLSVYSFAEAAYSKHHLQLLETVQQNFALALQNAKAISVPAQAVKVDCELLAVPDAQRLDAFAPAPLINARSLAGELGAAWPGL